jgi:heat shock protein HslJ
MRGPDSTEARILRATVDRMRIWPLLVLVLGCSAAVPPDPQSLDRFDGTWWQLTALRGDPVASTPRITLELELGRIGGFGGCNWYGAAYTFGDDGLVIGPAESTARACADRTIGERESRYFQALGEIASHEVRDGRLVFRDGRGEEILEFSPLERFDTDPASLEGTSWELESINGETVSGRMITLNLGRGTMDGFAGCRDYDGTWTGKKDAIAFTSISMRTLECEPEGLLLKEGNFTTLLSESRRYRLREDRLELSTDAGEVLVFRRK